MSESYFHIVGQSGAQTLAGEIPISGSKNAGLPVIAAALMCDAPVTYTNVSDIEDMQRMFELLTDLGVSVTDENDSVTIDASGISETTLTQEVSERFRASIILSGPLLAREGTVRFPHPGGCVIGSRPIDIFLHGFAALGAKIAVEDGMYTVEATELCGAEFFMPVASVTGTESLVLAALGARGITILKNASFEPEVVGLCEFLVAHGAEIEGIGTSTLIIHGRDGQLLTGTDMECAIIPDRIEAGSYLILGALLGKEITITHCRPDHLDAVLAHLRDVGAPIAVTDDRITVSGIDFENREPAHRTLKTHEYPGFPTDVQAPAAVLATQTPGETLMFETIFEGRLQYLHDLEAMGAHVDHWDAHRATVHGGTPLRGRRLRSPDIRAGLAFVIAAILADGESRIDNIYLIDRGYASIESKLKGVGVAIERRTV